MPTDDRLRSEATDELFKAILELKTPDECYRFFEDVATVGEMKALAQRWEVARRLEAGEHVREIAAETGASTATISRVNRCLNYGADGYSMMIDRLKGSPAKKAAAKRTRAKT